MTETISKIKKGIDEIIEGYSSAVPNSYQYKEEEMPNPYSKELGEVANLLAFRSLNYFYSNHKKRVLELSKIKTTTNSLSGIDLIQQFLKILVNIEQEKDVDTSKLFNPVPTNFSLRGTQLNLYTTKYGAGSVVTERLFNYTSQTLPYCCGVCEYGGFSYIKPSKVEIKLVHNLILDLIKLTADRDRKDHTGAVGLINYFIDTDFMETLLNRDDLELVKAFQNPKTGKKLNMFLFDTKISN